MKLIVGLGNPGEKYQKTRHNVGYMVAEQFLKDAEPIEKTVWDNENKFKSDIAAIDWQPKEHPLERVILVKPKTYMNNSGMAISLIKEFYKIDNNDIWVIYDDIDLPIGSFRIRQGGGAGGHRGIESIIASLGNGDFWRFRMGVGRPDKSLSTKGVDDYVLGTFSREERGKVRELIKRGAKAIETALEKDLQTAMNRYNTK